MQIRGERIFEHVVGNLITVGIVLVCATCLKIKVEKQLHLNGTTTKYTIVL
jgi:hypothetical protein